MMTIETVRTAATANAARLAELGSWPKWIDAVKSLTDRVPTADQSDAPGLDAGLCCALGLIPEGKQRLAAVLHAAYTEAAVEQVRVEMREPSPDSESVWWLAACSVCREGGIDEQGFLAQLEDFQHLATNADARVAAAVSQLDSMKKKFSVVGGIPFSTEDGGLQGAYLCGSDWGVTYASAYAIFFIGTFRATLGLEDFKFSELKDAKGRPMSGPVHGSKQFVKAASLEELAEVVKTVRAKLGMPKP